MEDFFDAGLDEMDLLNDKDPVEVNVNVDVTELAEKTEKAHQANVELFQGMSQNLEMNNASNRALLANLIELVNSMHRTEPIKDKIIGLKVRHNKQNRIDYLEFIREG